jgi:hypothetical protein
MDEHAGLGDVHRSIVVLKVTVSVVSGTRCRLVLSPGFRRFVARRLWTCLDLGTQAAVC